jgi:hypothetical protein
MMRCVNVAGLQQTRTSFWLYYLISLRYLKMVSFVSNTHQSIIHDEIGEKLLYAIVPPADNQDDV